MFPPVGDIYPKILDPEVKKENEFSCSQIQEHPQNFVVNVMSATVVFTMINNLISLGKIKKNFVKFDTDRVSIK